VREAVASWEGVAVIALFRLSYDRARAAAARRGVPSDV